MFRRRCRLPLLPISKDFESPAVKPLFVRALFHVQAIHTSPSTMVYCHYPSRWVEFLLGPRIPSFLFWGGRVFLTLSMSWVLWARVIEEGDLSIVGEGWIFVQTSFLVRVRTEKYYKWKTIFFCNLCKRIWVYCLEVHQDHELIIKWTNLWYYCDYLDIFFFNSNIIFNWWKLINLRLGSRDIENIKFLLLRNLFYPGWIYPSLSSYLYHSLPSVDFFLFSIYREL